VTADQAAFVDRFALGAVMLMCELPFDPAACATLVHSSAGVLRS
jgi:hypothetical protein